MEERGWLVAGNVVDLRLVDQAVAQFDDADRRRRVIRERAGVEGANDGTLHHLLCDHPVFIEILSQLRLFDDALRGFFDGNYILNSYGGVINRQDSRAYVHNVHRDIRFWSPARRFMINLLVMLDDFTVENGATHVLSGSHGIPDKPDAPRFEREAERAVGSRGSVLFFDSRLWHAAGENRTGRERRALTITLTSPFFKPQLDYPRLVGTGHPATADPFLRQIIGFNARVPASLEEYYVPLSQRFYQRGQDD